MEPTTAQQYIESLYKSLYSEIYSYIHGMCHNAHLSEDLTAETFERAMRAVSKDGADRHPTPAAWLRTISRNLLIDHWRRASRRHEVPTEITDDIARPHHDDAVSVAEVVEMTRSVLLALTPSQRQVVMLREFHDLNTAETAEEMGRSPQAVRSLHHKAKRRIEALRDEEPLGDVAEA